MDVHDLTAAYALDALEPAEVDAYEAHLAQCEECRAQLAELNEPATALAFGTFSPEPPARLRESILAEAAAQRTNVIPLRPRRWSPRTLVLVAAAAALVALGFGFSALRPSGGTHVISASLVVAADRTGTLYVSGLSAPPQGKVYEAWIIPGGGTGTPRRAGLFSANGVALRGTIPPHATVAVTIEPAGGDSAPTTPAVVTAQT